MTLGEKLQDTALFVGWLALFVVLLLGLNLQRAFLKLQRAYLGFKLLSLLDKIDDLSGEVRDLRAQVIALRLAKRESLAQHRGDRDLPEDSP